MRELAIEAKRRCDALLPEEREAQRGSWMRGMTVRCEHGIADFEQCADFRGLSKRATPGR